MATGRIKIGSEIKILMKEIRVGLILGGLYGLMLGVFAKFRFIDADPMLGVVVGLSIGSSMLIAVTVGTFIPMFLRKIDIDPAIATGPFVTTSIDILGVLLYFVIAGSLLAI
jgi:magnesium transporter